jgi:hypothetical protein
MSGPVKIFSGFYSETPKVFANEKILGRKTAVTDKTTELDLG